MKKKQLSVLWPERTWQKLIKVMKLSFILLFLGCLQVTAGSYAQDAIVSVTLKNASFEEVINVLEKTTNYTFLYRNNQISHLSNLDVDFTQEDIKVVLEHCLRDSGLTYKLVDNTIVIQPAPPQTQEETIRVSGTIKSEKGETLPHVTVRVKGTNIGFATNAQGTFNTELIKRNNMVLVFSYVGYQSEEVKVVPGEHMNVVLKETAYTLEESIVTGVGIDKPKESFVGAVTTITQEDIKREFSRNLLQTLSNIDPSFRIIENNQQGSNPNALPDVQLRGATSFSDFSALRGATRSTVNLPLFVLDGFEVALERVMDLNQDEIESINLLKDASATALYGSRGANGVVVITTTRPVMGKLQVRYTGNLRLEIPDLSSYNLVDAREKLELENAAGAYSQNPELYEILQERVASGVNTNWLKEPVQTGIGHEHRLSMTGGDATYRYSINANYNDHQGVMKGSYRKNFNGTINLNYIKNNLYINNSLSINLNNSEESPYGSYSDIARLNPYWTPKDEKDEFYKVFYHVSQLGTEVPNPIYNGSLNYWNKAKGTMISNNFSARYTLWESFRIETRFGLSRSIKNTDIFKPASHTDFRTQGDINKRGSYSKNETTGNNYDFGLTLNYGKTFNEKHIINAGISTRLQQKKTDNYRMIATGFINDNMDHISNALTYQEGAADADGPSGSESTMRNIEFLSTVNYNYDMRYFVDLTYRTDGNSSFGSNSRWGSFYSGGVGWTISREKFFNIKPINLLRAKYSYGVSGSMNFSPYQSMYVLEYDLNQNYNNQQGAYLQIFGNQNLKWQNTYQHNTSLDFELYEGWVQGTFTYYNKLTKNAIIDIMLPISHGYESYVANSGSTRNEGLELQLSTYIVRNSKFQLSIRGRAARNKNTIVAVSEELRRKIEIEVENSMGSDLRYTYREGSSMDAIYVLKSLGIDPASGKRIYLDSEGNATFYKHVNARYKAGNTQPKIDGTFSLYAAYKGLMLNVGFQFRYGGQQLNSTLLEKVENANIAHNVDKRVYHDRWREKGDITRYKSIFSSEYTYSNDLFVQDENTLRCTNINLSYDFPRAWVKKNLRMEMLNVTAYLSDIFYISTIRRERGTSYPFSVNPNFSITCSF